MPKPPQTIAVAASLVVIAALALSSVFMKAYDVSKAMGDRAKEDACLAYTMTDEFNAIRTQVYKRRNQAGVQYIEFTTPEGLSCRIAP